MAILGLFCAPAFATTKSHFGRFLIENWETDDGLPENSATSIVQTPDGYLWFGTFNGLVRFDGMRFTTLNKGNSPGVPGPAVVNLHLDRQNSLWVSGEDGLARLELNGWRTFPWTGGFVRTFAETSRGELFASGFTGGIFRFANDRFEPVPAPVDTQDGYLLAIDEADRLLAAHANHLWRYEAGDWRELTTGLKDFRMGPGRGGTVWLATTNGIARFEKGAIVSREEAPFPMRDIWSVQEDSERNVWVASFTEGVYIRSNGGGWERYYEDRGLAHGGVRCVTEDREGNRWIGTSGGGLHRFTPSRFSSLGKWAGLPERVVKAVVSDGKNGIYIGTYGGGVAHWGDSKFHRMGGDVSSVPGRFVYSLLRRRDGTVLAGTHQMGVLEVTDDSYRQFATIGPKDEVFALFEDASGVVWIGADNGLFRVVDGQAQSVNWPDGKPVTQVRDIDQTGGGRILIACHNGLAWFANGKLTLAAEWEYGPATALHVESETVAWVATQGKGLVRFTANGARVMTEAQGTPNNIGAIMPDAEGNLWLTSNEGIVRVEKAGAAGFISGKSGAPRTQWFDLADGLPSVECPIGYSSTATIGTNGWLWFATLKGVALVHPGGLKINRHPPPVVIEELRIDQESIPVHRPGFLGAGTNRIVIPAGSRRVEIVYSALSLTAPQKLEFQTRVEGLDSDWQNVDTRRVAYLQDLRPGDYVFRVRASNNDRVWNETGATLAFTVQPFFWQTWWFGLGSTALVAAFGLLGFRVVVRSRVGRQVERVRQEAALSEVQARLASVLENTSDVVSFATPQGNILYLNSSGRRLLGLREGAQVSHLRLGDLHPEWARRRIETEALPTAIKTGAWQGETALADHNHKTLPVSQLILAHRHADNSIDFLSTIARDLSEARRSEEARVALEKQLRAAQKMEALGTLAGGIAHDFNNILTGILGNAELLKFTLPQRDSNAAQVDNIIRASSRARDLIKQMLAFGRPQESGRAAVRIWKAIEEAIVLLRASIPASIEIEAACADESAVVNADLVQIHQVIMNLGANAAHAMSKEGGKLTFRQESIVLNEEGCKVHEHLRPGAWVRVNVTDTGTGMTPEVLERIFEPFFTTKAPGQGTGLGLSVVHGIVGSHGGVVTVRSKPGVGSTFEIYLPQAETREESEPRRAPEIPHGGGERILVVDDEELVLNVAQQFLHELGYQCRTMPDGVEALVELQNNARNYDLLLTDLTMPRMSGLALATAAHEIRPDLPIVMATGFSGRLKPGDAEKAGVRTILAKPYNLEELARALHEALTQRA